MIVIVIALLAALLPRATLAGTGDATAKPGIVNFNGGRLFLRDVKTTGYARALGDVSHTPIPPRRIASPAPTSPVASGPTSTSIARTPRQAHFPPPPARSACR